MREFFTSFFLFLGDHFNSKTHTLQRLTFASSSCPQILYLSNLFVYDYLASIVEC